jgi:3-oxoacyl-[acyl-carrier-protein] synthase II
MNRRVVITGMAGLTSLGTDWETVRQSLREARSGVTHMGAWDRIEGLQTRLAAPVVGFEQPAHYPRKKTRSMGRLSLLATRATELALNSAGLLGSPLLTDGTTGIAYGSSNGSPTAVGLYGDRIVGKETTRGIGANDYVQLMSHTCAANLAQFFEVRGRILSTCTACTSGSQGIGYAFEAVKNGYQEVMIGGGAEELHVMEAAVFDILYSASTRNQEPHLTPRPFDEKRDGLVVGEGAGTFVLENLEHAQARQATIYGEIRGFGTNCDGQHLTHPSPQGMEQVMRLALKSAELDPCDIHYVNAHGTATEVGDIAESAATHAVFGDKVPVSTLKGHLGHTLGACGALEAWITLEMLTEAWAAPTLNLDDIDPRCAPLDYIRSVPRPLSGSTAMSNNFAFGGINTSLILQSWSEADH